VARHERNFGRYEQVLDLEHYLDVLERKPGALAGSRPLQQWRERVAGRRVSTGCGRVWNAAGQAGRHAKMIELLQLGSKQGWDRLKQAVEQALDWAARMRRRCGICWSSETGACAPWNSSCRDWNATSVRCR
jgi:hypothetical protein